MANQVDFKILPSDQFNVYSPQTRSEKVITYFTLLSKLRGDILAVSSQDDPNSIISAYYTNVGNTQTLHLVKADGSEVTASNSFAGTVTSVDMSVPTGFAISGNPITTSGTLNVSFASGYSLPTNALQATWTTAYNRSITSAAVTGTSTKTLTLNQQDGGTVTASWTDQGLTSVGLTMPAAFNVANSPLTSNGTIAVTAAGLSSQYIRGDGQLANFPSGGGGGSAVNYYLNGSVNQGTFGGTTYYQMSRTPISGAGTNFTRTSAQGDGYVASFITDAGDPDLLNIPGGNWNLEFYFNSSSSGGAPAFYGELYKVSASNVFTLISSGSTNAEVISGGTTVDQYYTSIAVPQTTLLSTDRLAIRVYVIVDGRNITLHTEDNNFSEVITTFSTGLNALNGLTDQVQYFATGTSGTDFNIVSATDTHTFNIPTASGTNRGLLSSSDWTTFNNKASDSFKTIAVSGQSDVVADSATDTLTFEAGSNIVITTDATNDKITITALGGGSGSVTSVDMSVPTGFAISGNPITTSGTLALAFASGYSLPTNASQTNWNTAYDNSITAFAYNTSTGVLTLTQQDAGTLTATVTLQPFTTDNLTQGSTNLYDKVVSLTGAGTTVVTGTYPNFTITSNDQHVGTVTSIATSAPITGGTITTSGTIGITQSGTAADGYLSSTDWNTFNSKVGGSGTINYVSKWTSTGAIGNSQIFDSGTYVGINTATPAAKLDISGAHVASIGLLRLNSSAANVAAQTYYIDGVYKAATYAGTDDNFYILGRDADIVFSTTSSTTTRMVITNGGNVGIGTSGPTQKLMVSGSIRVTGGYYDSSNSIGSNGQVLASTGSGTTWINASGGTVNGSGTVNYLSKWTGTTLLSDSLIYDNGTNIGIGTTAPGQKVDVVGAAATDTYLRVLGGAGTTKGGIIVGNNDSGKNYGSLFFDNANNNVYLYQQYSSGDLVLGTNTNEKMRITSGGNVGIGNTGPSQKLHVEGNIRVTGAYYDSLNSAGTSGQILSSTATGTAWISQTNVSGSGTTNYVSKWTSGTAIGNSSIFDNGNVGISTASPSAKLEVSAGVGTPGFNNGIAIVTGNGTYTANHGGILQFQNEDVITAAIRGVRESGWGSGLALYTHNTSSGNTFGTTVVERMRIAESGNVGIGTTAPAQKVQIGDGTATGSQYFRIFNSASDIYVGQSGGIIFGFSANSAGFVLSDNTSFPFGIGTTNAQPFVIGTTNAERMRITSAGNVGIGTTAPGYKLDVSAAARIYGVRIGRDFSIADRATVRLDSNGNAPADILFGQTSAANQTGWDGVYWSISSRSSGAGAAEGNKFTIWRGDAHSAPNNSESQFITITPGLNLGIGETSPTQKLHVSGNVRVTGAYYDSSNAAGTSGQILSSTGTGTAWISPGGGGGIITGSGTTNYVTKWTSGTAVGDSSIYDNGNVGIGTTAPNSRLSVNGGDFEFNRGTGALGNNYVVINKGASNDGGVILRRDNANDWQIVNAVGTGNLAFYSYGSASEVLTIFRSNGNVGIGTTAPSQLLHVSGNIRVTGAYYDSANSAGTSGQILSSTGTGTAWIAAPSGGGVTGSGTTNYVTKWTSGTAVGNSSIYDNGNVGIGTTAPPQALSVIGNIYQRTGDFITWDNGDAQIGAVAGYALAFSTYNGSSAMVERMRITSAGTLLVGTTSTTNTASGKIVNRVGGTSNPDLVLNGGAWSIASVGGEPALYLSSSIAAATGIPGATQTAKGGIGFEYLSAAAPTDLVLGIFGSPTVASTVKIFNNTERMRITSDGNVGIGATSPTTTLDVRRNVPASSGTFPVVRVGNSSGDWGNYSMIEASNVPDGRAVRFGAYLGASAYSQGGFAVVTGDNGDIGTNPSIKLFVRHDGNVGIGTTAPTYKLDVNGTFRSNAFFTLSNGISYWGPNGVEYGYLTWDTGYAKIGASATNTLYLGGGNQITILNGGNVGIGTTAPNEKLHVFGTIEVSGYQSIGNGPLTMLKSSYAGGPYCQVRLLSYNPNNAADADFGLQVMDSGGTLNEAIRVVGNTLNVGLGTSSPSNSFTINRSTAAGTVSAIPGIAFRNRNTTNSIFVHSGIFADTYRDVADPHYSGGIWFTRNPEVSNLSSSSDIVFGTGFNVGTGLLPSERMRVTSSGNVGIGTTSPGATLDVAGNIFLSETGRLQGRGYPYDTTVGSGADASTSFIEAGSTAGYRSRIALAGGNATDPNTIKFLTTSAERMRITSAGNVGIGTTSPSIPRGSGFRPMLHVYNNSVGTNPSVVVSCEDNQMAGYIAGDNAGASDIGWGWNAYYQGSGNNFFNIRIGDNGTWTDRFTIDRYGNAGIGTTSPAYKLDVSGTIRATGDVIAYSDARVKENIETLDGALDKVIKMRGVSYNKIGEQEKKVGVIAQEILEVLPEVVSQDETGTYSVAYGNIVSVLIEAIKEQQKQIDELKAKLK